MTIKRLDLAIVIGVLIRLVLLYISIPVNGYYGGDAIRYIATAQNILSGEITAYTFWYPPGYPLLTAFFLAIFKNVWMLSLFQISFYVVGSIWIRKRLGGFATWFLALDPIWLSQTALIATDFLAALLFGILFLKITENKKQKTQTLVLIGLGLSFCVFLKPVYLWVPLLLLFFIWHNKRVVLWVLGVCYIPILLYSAYRFEKTGSPAISGHGDLLFGRYTIGSFYVAEGKTSNLYEAMDMASKDLTEKQKIIPQFTWRKFIISKIIENPMIFLKLFITSAYKAVFGHANVTFAYYKHGQEIQGPGLWVQFSRGHSLLKTLKEIDYFWLFGMLFSLIERLILLLLAFYGARKLLHKKHYIQTMGCLLLVFYFALTPFVFGEPRYFLPATIVLLWLISQFRVKNKANA